MPGAGQSIILGGGIFKEVGGGIIIALGGGTVKELGENGTDVGDGTEVTDVTG